MTCKHLAGRPSLKRVFLLIDSRRGIAASDQKIMGLLDESAVSWAIVVTKADKQRPEALIKLCKETMDEISKYVAAFPEIFVTSSEDGTGVETLRANLAGFSLTKKDSETHQK